MKITLLTEIPAPYRIPLFNALATSRGVDLEVLFLAERDPRRQYPVYEHEFLFRRRVLEGAGFVGRGRWLVLNRGTRRELDRFDPDIVLLGGWNQPAFWTGLRWAQRRGRPVILWVESTARDERSGNALLERLKRRAVAAAAAFLVPGRAARDYVESLGVAPERIVVAPNAVDLSIFSVDVDRRGRDGCTFLYVGRFSQEKGVDVLLRAFQHGVPGRLVLAGSGPQEEQVRGLAGDGVELLGHVPREQLPALYASADCLVLPSRSEAWGMVLNEAAAAGLPLVATEAAGGGYDLIEEGVNGYRTPVEDPDALAEALRQVAADPEWRLRAGVRSRELTAGYTGEAWAEAVRGLVDRYAPEVRPRRVVRAPARIALLTEIPAPYRIPLFNALAGTDGIDLQVLFLAERDPRRQYPVYEEEFRFSRRVLRGAGAVGRGRWVVLSRGTRHELDAFDPDIVLLGGWNQPAFWTGLRWARTRNRPVVLWVESTLHDERSGSLVLERLKRRAVGAAAGFLGPGRAALVYVESLGVEPERIVIAPNAVDLSIFAVDADRRTRDGCTFLYVGRLAPEKGLDVLLQAFEEVPGRLLIAGSGPQEAELRARTNGRVELLGQLAREDLPALYAGADCFVLPSRSEPWGMVLNEAAAAGLPLVATVAAGAGYDLFEEGVNGYRVPVDDPAALAGALRTVAADREWRLLAGERSRELTAGYTGDAWAAAVSDLVRLFLD